MNVSTDLCYLITPAAGPLANADVMSTEMNGLASPLASKLMCFVYDHWRWYYIFYIFLVWEIRRIVWTFWRKAPVSISDPTPFALSITLTASLVKCYDSCVSDTLWQMGDSRTDDIRLRKSPPRSL